MSDSIESALNRPLHTSLGWVVKLLLPLVILAMFVDGALSAGRVTFDATVVRVNDNSVAVEASRSELDSTERPEVTGALMAMGQPQYRDLDRARKDSLLSQAMTRSLGLDDVAGLGPVPLPAVGDTVSVSIMESGPAEPRLDYDVPWALLIGGLVGLMLLNVYLVVARARLDAANPLQPAPAGADATAPQAVTGHQGPFI
jgi:uncharacterized membrane protein